MPPDHQPGARAQARGRQERHDRDRDIRRVPQRGRKPVLPHGVSSPAPVTRSFHEAGPPSGQAKWCKMDPLGHDPLAECT
ncbi:MAG: hypothetical protein AVDCRST_MAG02-49 [uncultured Rubrobacteraceae bacterium]|uniref:Uncharacterized protein n=1 Tax=uncultured Rubrobacteraceae bacterium TaxID=349277 RepID=A0A6J4QH62_9ACTN|nr:MAG: hypothetical protein AVDCRST_MAG02-49 [uncultured Rubrobacteraceae bacterium]